MKICIIYGNERRENTYNTVKVIKDELKTKDDIEFEEYFLPKDMPKFCNGCFNCFYYGKEKCPHSEYTLKIYNSFKNADGIIFASPTYVMDVTGQMKTFLDHFGHMYIVHMPMEEMFKKSVFIVSTTAGTGTKHVINTIKRSVKYWGVSKIVECGLNVRSSKWNDISQKNKEKFIKKLKIKSNKFYNSIGNNNRPSLFVRIMFNTFIKVHKMDNAINIEKEYWKNKGWLDGKKPWK